MRTKTRRTIWKTKYTYKKTKTIRTTPCVHIRYRFFLLILWPFHYNVNFIVKIMRKTHSTRIDGVPISSGNWNIRFKTAFFYFDDIVAILSRFYLFILFVILSIKSRLMFYACLIILWLKINFLLLSNIDFWL